jgi:hypothetical protein
MPWTAKPADTFEVANDALGHAQTAEEVAADSKDIARVASNVAQAATRAAQASTSRSSDALAQALAATQVAETAYGMIVAMFGGVYSNATRPAATTFAAGVMIFNTDDCAPNWSDGSVWRDAYGILT